MKLGIVGNGMIVQTAMDALRESKVSCTALWARSKEKGNAFLGVNGIERIYDDYAAFLMDESFDTVYIGLPNHLHTEYARQAILAGKHVIVEKPFVVETKDARELIELAKEKGVYLFEAIMSRYSANLEALKSRLHQLGTVRLMRSNMCQYSSRYDAYLKKEVMAAMDPKCAGGALYDLNVYNIHMAVSLYGNPQTVVYMANIGFNGIDTSGVLVLDYGSFKAVCVCAKDSSSPGEVVIQGECGTLTMSSRPGVVKNLNYHNRKENVDEIWDTANEENPMRTEFERIAKAIDEREDKIVETWLQETVIVMEILCQAKQSAGLSF